MAQIRRAFEALQAGRFAEAAEAASDLAANGDMEARLLLGLGLGGDGQPEDAAALLVEIADARPQALHPCLDLVTLLQKQQRAAEAEPVFQACLRLSPDEPRLHLAYGQFLNEQYRYEEAEQAVLESLRLTPNRDVALNQLAIIRAAQGRIDEALDDFREVVARDPRNFSAWANIGCTLTGENRFEEALDAYRRSITIKPDEPQIRLNHSITLLKAGRMVQGWTEHEWRFALPGHTEFGRDRMLPNVTAGTDWRGKRVLLTHEEGLGDTLMYLRYVPLLAKLGLEVEAWVPKPLAQTAGRVEGMSRVIVTDRLVLEADWHCPFISLPRVFSGTRDIWGPPGPYLHTDPNRVAAAAAHMPGPERLRVGLVWGGAPRPSIPTANAIDRRRSMHLAELAPLSQLRNVSLVSLQMGAYAEELADPHGLRITDPTGFIGDMDDTASLMRHLDVLVSVDTSVVHLAGGLGVPVLLMDRYDNCWRWFHGREDSVWYPSLSIFRQERPNDWAGVVRRVVGRLQAMAEAYTPPPRNWRIP